MKIKHILVLLVLSFVLFSCSSDDASSGSETSGDIVGKWRMTSVSYSGQTVTEASGLEITSNFTGTGFDIDSTLEFTETPDEFVSEGEYSIELTYDINGSNVTTETQENLPTDQTGEWTKSGNTLTFIISGESDDVTIEELTGSTLRIRTITVEDLSQAGATVTSTTDLVSTFERVE